MFKKWGFLFVLILSNASATVDHVHCAIQMLDKPVYINTFDGHFPALKRQVYLRLSDNSVLELVAGNSTYVGTLIFQRGNQTPLFLRTFKHGEEALIALKPSDVEWTRGTIEDPMLALLIVGDSAWYLGKTTIYEGEASEVFEDGIWTRGRIRKDLLRKIEAPKVGPCTDCGAAEVATSVNWVPYCKKCALDRMRKSQ